MTGWTCRLAVNRGGSWSYKTLNVASFGMTSKDLIQKFNPLFMRLFGSIVTDALGIQAKQFPSLMVDFMKWDETITLKCFYGDSGGNYKATDLAAYYSQLRNWILEKEMNINNQMFVQLITANPTSTTDPQVKFDPIQYPLGVFPGWGYQGMVTDITLEPWEAGQTQINFSLTYQVGIVVPV